MVDKIVNMLMKRTYWVLTVIVLLTLFFGYYWTRVEVVTKFSNLLPIGQPYVKIYDEFRKRFGSANVLFIALEAQKGNMFEYRKIQAVREITDAVDVFPGIDHGAVTSLTHLSTRDVIVYETGAIQALPLIPIPIPESPEDLKKIEFRTYANPSLIGDLISLDGKSALVRAAFIEGALDYPEIFGRVQKLQKKIETENPDIKIYVAGDPMLRGWVYHYLTKTNTVMAATALGMVLLLAFYFRRFYGVFVPLFCTCIAAVWGIGIIGLLGYTIEPLMMVVPFLLSARAVSHGVQLIERFYEEYEVTKDKRKAAENSTRALLIPATASIWSDAAGLACLATASFPLLTDLGIYLSIWAVMLTPTISFFLPCLLLVLPAPKRTQHYIFPTVSHVLNKVCWLVTHRYKAVVISCVVIFILGALCLTKLVVGTKEVGSTLLFPNSDYNVSARQINKNFGGTNNYQIYLGGDKNMMAVDHGPAILNWVKKYTALMLADEAVGGGRDLARLTGDLYQRYHFNEPKWNLIPTTKEEVSNILFVYTWASPLPGLLAPWIDEELSTTAVTLYIKDLRSETLSRIDKMTKDFIAKNKLPDEITVKMAGGIVGLTTATVREITDSNIYGTIVVVVVVFFLILASYRSMFAGLIMFFTLGVSTIVVFAYMALRGQGVDIDTLPIICIGVGVGIDYAIYIFDRILLEYRGDLAKAVETAIKTTGMAVFFTATTLCVGVIFWKFLSPLRFHADMSLLIVILMMLSMLFALILLPSVIVWFKPKVIINRKGGE